MRRRNHMELAADVEISAVTRDEVRGPVPRVWDVLYEPESVVGHMGVVAAGRADGSPIGPGEIQFCVRRERGRSIRQELEVIEFELGRRVLHRTRGEGEGVVNVVTELVLEDLADGRVAVTHTLSMVLPEGTQFGSAKACQRSLEHGCRALSRWVRSVLS